MGKTEREQTDPNVIPCNCDLSWSAASMEVFLFDIVVCDITDSCSSENSGSVSGSIFDRGMPAVNIIAGDVIRDIVCLNCSEIGAEDKEDVLFAL